MLYRKHTTLLLAALLFCLYPLCRADASWIVDAARYHISVHGQTSCIDCHDDINTDEHPKTENVNLDLRSLFKPDKCSNCHDDPEYWLKEGKHGDLTVKSIKDIENCLDCHDPHYQGAPKKSPDLSDAEGSCGDCHESQNELPGPDEENSECYSCHVVQAANGNGTIHVEKRLCLSCHGEEKVGLTRIDIDHIEKSAHGDLACTVCHLKADQYRHKDQKQGDCLTCHGRHDEKTARDAHYRVDCRACHMEALNPYLDEKSGLIRAGVVRDSEKDVHALVVSDDEKNCQRCHQKDNALGAASMVLPAKSIICMPCHAATLSVGDPVSAIAVIIFVLGLVFLISIWTAGSRAGHEKVENKGAGQGILNKSLSVLRVILWDVLLVGGLYQRSRIRWLIHGLIFYPFVIRFFWGLAALTVSLWNPDSGVARLLLDKNSPLSGLIFDLTGLMVISGVLTALIKKLMIKETMPKGLPARDYLALALLGLIFVSGFVVEAVRIAMTGRPAGAEYAFIGYAISAAFSNGRALTGIYGWLWYAHAVLVGCFVAYLPFSRMFHMLAGPIVMIMNKTEK